MKKIILLMTCILGVSMVSFTGCGNEPYDYDLTKYIKIGDYKGIEYLAPEDIKVSEDEINERIEEDLEEAKYLDDVADGKVHDGNTLNIDFAGTIDGESFEGGTSEGFTLEVGSGSMIDGFESGLIGESVGETVTLDIEFPEEYPNNPDLAGKPVTFDVTINSCKEYVTPDVEKYVKDKGEYESVNAYKDAVEKEIYNEKEADQLEEIKAYMWAEVMATAEVIEYPEKEIEAYKEDVISRMNEYAEENSMTFEDLVETSYDLTVDEFYDQLQTGAEQNAKEQMVVYMIAREEGLEISNDEYKEFIEKQLEAIGYTEKQFEEYTGSSYVDYVGGEDYVKYYMLYEKVVTLIYENGKAVESLS